MKTSQIISLLHSLAADKNSSSELIETAIKHFIFNKPSLPFTEFHFKFVVRCSPNDLFPGEIFRNVSRCSYNPNPTSMGRCNYVGQSVFYAAVTSNTKNVIPSATAILESSFQYIRRKDIQRMYLTLSKWDIKRPLKLFVLPFSSRSHRVNYDFRFMNKKFNLILKNSCLNRYYFQEIRKFLMFISNVFSRMRKREYFHRISSAFYNVIMKISPTIDGLLYPSAMTKAEGMNIALRKELIDDKILECNRVIMHVLQRSPSNPKEIIFPLGSPEANIDRNGKISFERIF